HITRHHIVIREDETKIEKKKNSNLKSLRSKYSQRIHQQMHKHMQSMVRIGENKHKAKQTSLDGSTEGIFSKSTYDNYKQVSAQFIAWLKEQYSNIKHI